MRSCGSSVFCTMNCFGSSAAAAGSRLASAGRVAMPSGSCSCDRVVTSSESSTKYFRAAASRSAGVSDSYTRNTLLTVSYERR
jgi:hypothetical protein